MDQAARHPRVGDVEVASPLLDVHAEVARDAVGLERPEDLVDVDPHQPGNLRWTITLIVTTMLLSWTL